MFLVLLREMKTLGESKVSSFLFLVLIKRTWIWVESRISLCILRDGKLLLGLSAYRVAIFTVYGVFIDGLDNKCQTWQQLNSFQEVKCLPGYSSKNKLMYKTLRISQREEWSSGLRLCNKNCKVPISKPARRSARLRDPTSLGGSRLPSGWICINAVINIELVRFPLEKGRKLAVGQPNSS